MQAVEAAGVLGASVLAGIDAVSGRSYHVNSGIALTVIGVATAIALGYVATGLGRARRWSRTPALLTQLFAGIVSIYLLQADRYDWGGAGLALAAAGFVALLVPPSMRALAGGHGLADRREPADEPGAAGDGDTRAGDKADGPGGAGGGDKHAGDRAGEPRATAPRRRAGDTAARRAK